MDLNLDIEKIRKSNFCNKNKKIFNIDDADVNKILVSKECGICHHWYFKGIGFNMNLIFVMDAMI